MKKCDSFKDLILTEYIDGRLKGQAAAPLEDHLLNCADCSAFLNEVKSTAQQPFQQAERLKVPEELWERVKEGLQEPERPGISLEGVLKPLKGLFVFPRLVPVFASLAMMLIIGSFSFQTFRQQQARDAEGGAYLASTLSMAAVSSGENNDLGTPIERYFL